MRRTIVAASCFIAIAAAAAEAADEGLGRLFFTPQQRAALDAGRRIAAAKPKAGMTSAKRPVRELRLDGIVTRSDGERTVWVNGSAYHGGQSAGLRVTPVEPEAARIHVGESGRAIKLRVGETHGRSGTARNTRQEAAPSKPDDRPGE